MKIENETLQVLKNFSRINNSIFIEANSGVIKTLAPSKKILAEYRNCQSFPVDVCIYDLSKLINVLSNLDDNDIQFEEHFLEIGRKTKIWFADPEVITYPTKMINMSDISVTLDINESQIDEIIKFSGIMGIDTIQITQEGNEVVVRLQDIKNPSSNVHVVSRTPAKDPRMSFNFFFSVENLKLIPGDYLVECTEKIVSRFSHKTMDLTYWIAMDATSQAPVEKAPAPVSEAAPVDEDETPF